MKHRSLLRMKMRIITLLGICILFSACSQKSSFNRKAGNLRLAMDTTGKIVALEDVSNGRNYIDASEGSSLLECQKYGDSTNVNRRPESMEIVKQTKAGTELALTYNGGLKLTVRITPKEGYFRMEVIGAEPDSEISGITWGPYKTTMKGQIGEWIGLNRSDDFTIGMFSLEPNTDGSAASYTKNGSSLQLFSYDNTRGRFVWTKDERLRTAVPVPGLTVRGSAVALFGCAEGKDNELNVIGKIETEEHLPHPMYQGQWNKYSKESKKLCIWTNPDDPSGVGEKNFTECLELGKEMGARILCRMHGFSRNWGHFDIDPPIYPGGINAVRADSKTAQKEGIGLTLYTLTTFIKPHPDPEPYLAPVPDERLQTWKPRTELTRNIDLKDQKIVLQNREDVVAALNAASNRVVRIDDELIEFKDFSVNGNEIIAKECERGAFFTKKASHSAGSIVKLMYVAGFHNFYPGTLDMSNEIADRLGQILVDADLDNFVVDGFESCLETGYGFYTGNIFLQRIFDRCKAHHKEILATGSTLNNFSWHFMSDMSWGEYDLERGFRGTMLDYRLHRQVQLKRNLMPNKLGQYYPDNATAEDINWLMGLVAGWDAGVDFNLDVKQMRNNPEYKKIVGLLHLWQEAIAGNVFTEQQKMALRQTDVLYTLSKKADGKWDLTFDRFWQNEKIKVLPPSSMPVTVVNGGPESVKPCSIDWSWTHNPGLYDEVGLSDDLVHSTETVKTIWRVKYPSYTEPETSWYPSSDRYFQLVIRLPKDAPCAVKNVNVSANNETVEIPCTLEPGQYISIPHIDGIACVYNEKHQVIKEIYLHGDLPKIRKGSTAEIGISCEPVKAGTKSEVILNLRYQNGFFFE